MKVVHALNQRNSGTVQKCRNLKNSETWVNLHGDRLFG